MSASFALVVQYSTYQTLPQLQQHQFRRGWVCDRLCAGPRWLTARICTWWLSGEDHYTVVATIIRVTGPRRGLYHPPLLE